MKRRTIQILLLMLLAVPAAAQIVYECDFENVLERQQWVLNPSSSVDTTTQWQNRWYLGSPGNFSQKGHWGMYISLQDMHDEPIYKSNSPSNTVAYRELTLSPDSYTLEFDWRALGMGQNATLEVFWIPQTVNTYCSNLGKYSNRLAQYKIPNATFYGSKPWQPARLNFTVTQADSVGKLVFMWVTYLRDAVKAPSACVDNIVISKQGGSCPQPTNLKYDKMTGNLSWNGNASWYEIRDYAINNGAVNEYTGVTTKSHTLTITSEGTHNFYVRAYCDSTTWSTWVMTSLFTWIPGSRCIDYLDLGPTPNNKGVCYVGDFDEFIRNGRQGTLGMVDEGPGSPESMHTIHTDLNEIDPNTTVDGGLSTVPDGEIASVRLGAYTSSGQSARVEYKYKVQAGQSDLLDLKYAVVMESGGHGSTLQDADMNPTFTCNILDGNGRELDGCTQLYFVAGFGDQSNWHQEPGNTDLYWCNWATVTVSLRQYVGQTLTIRLTSARCSWDYHPAYAYFTISCRGGQLEGMACGDYATDHFEAPEGFNYRWYKEADPGRTTLSTDRIFNIAPNEDQIYMVECHSIVDPTCYFTLTANPNPRYPVAVVDTVVSHKNCQNIVDFANNSVIQIISRADGSVMSDAEPIQTIVYDYGDGSDPEVVDGETNRHIYPVTGGTFHTLAIASMNDGMCQDTVAFDITLPDLLHTGDADYVHMCDGDYYVLPTRDTVFADTTYVYYTQNIYGCQAPNELHVLFHPVSFDTTVVELCEGSYYDFEGTRYDRSGVFTVPLRTVHGCDSLLTLALTVIPKLLVETPDSVPICADEAAVLVPYQRVQGHMTDIHVRMSDEAQYAGFNSEYHFTAGDQIIIPTPANLRAGYYEAELEFTAPSCQSDPQPLVIVAHYPTSVIRQKNTLLALLNEEYNGGGYIWTGYQWYCNGVPVAGATTSYIVVDDSHLGDEFYCLLVRDDSVKITTCPVVYNAGHMAVDNATGNLYVTPTTVNPGEPMQVIAHGELVLYDVVGRSIARYGDARSATRQMIVTAPDRAGIYILKDSNHATAKIIVR